MNVFDENIIFLKKCFRDFWQKSPADLNSRSVFHKSSALDHWAMMIYNQVNRYKQFHKIFISLYCDIGSSKVEPLV